MYKGSKYDLKKLWRYLTIKHKTQKIKTKTLKN